MLRPTECCAPHSEMRAWIVNSVIPLLGGGLRT